MKQRLERLARQIELEILTTCAVVVRGQKMIKTSLSDNPYAGLCRGAIEKLKELAPDLDVTILSIGHGRFVGEKKHVLGEVNIGDDSYWVDPTIKQCIPEAKIVYGPNDLYPLKINEIKRL